MIYTDPLTATMNSIGNTTRGTTSNQIDKTTFLKLLVMQMSNQDPLEPMTNENFIGQVAQFNELEQSMNLNESFANFLNFQAITQASSLIGKNVESLYSDGETTGLVSGKVEEVIVLDSTPILKLSSGYEVPIQMVVRVTSDS